MMRDKKCVFISFKNIQHILCSPDSSRRLVEEVRYGKSSPDFDYQLCVICLEEYCSASENSCIVFSVCRSIVRSGKTTLMMSQSGSCGCHQGFIGLQLRD